MRPALWGAGLVVAALTLAAVVWSGFFRIPIAVSGQGIILAPAGIADVVANAPGQVRELAVQPGHEITEGAVVARISQPDVDLNLAVARGELEDARTFLNQLTDFHQRDVASRDAARAARARSLRERIEATKGRRDALIAQGRDLQQLVEKGLVRRDRLLDLNHEILIAEGQIADAEDELEAIASNAAIEATEEQRERLEAERRITEALRKVRSLTEQLERMGAVRSPFVGRVVESKVNVGQMVESGTPVITLERRDPEQTSRVPIVVTYVEAADGKKIQPGMEVEISPSTTTREEHGFIRGTVTHVSDVPASSAGMLRALQNDHLVQSFVQRLGAPFEVTVLPESHPDGSGRLMWSSQRPNPPRIESGTMAEVRITTRSNSLLSLAIPAFKYLGADPEDQTE
ncbi:NHLP bacteriocin system secretion protein [Aquibaculum arenosum]|uniref:NHLP bacteriocin system secretion protein n=1 Tax=Aquibaculum arenosum TaxID=3032591 RepID=A0ABT5YMI5_9PROT|nr:NHLP bacteriocin system secretion protein [Fodinicurvata sp. CAU 1616]MDF2096112.1 NHLP bacteriocin system secretion protein [Fodinicurvata sp. CAU 1616]